MPKIHTRTDGLRAYALKILAVLLVLGAAEAVCSQPLPAAEIGSKLDNFQMTDVSGKIQSLRQYEGKIVVLFFWSFKCPVSLTYVDRMEALRNKYGNQEVILLGVASGLNESQEEIRANASNLKIKVPILLDSDGDLMDKLGATHTPSVFILDQNAVLRYRGAPDNNRTPGEKGRVAYMDEAIESLLNGRAISVPETPVFGCSIKRRRIKE
jgi:alkyl hydroperoxide reductase subunit AhpC